MKAKVAWLEGPWELVWRTELLPELGEKDVRANSIWSSISPGTEVAAFTGAPPLRPMKVYPRLVGYCNVAVVDAVGPAVSLVKPGDVILTHQSHRTAFICPETSILTVLDPGQDARAASSAYLFHLGLSAVQKAGICAGHRVAVIGLGTLGLASVSMASLAGATVTAFTGQTDIAKIATAMGAASVLPKNNEGNTDHFDIVITTSNLWSDWKLALEVARYAGIVASLGFPGRGQPQPDFNPLASEYFYDKQLTFMACGNVPRIDALEHEIRFTLKRNMAWLTSMIGSGRLLADLLLTETIRPEQLESAYSRLASRERNLLSMAIQWTKENFV